MSVSESPCPKWSEEEPHEAHFHELPFGHGQAHCPGWAIGEVRHGGGTHLKLREGDQPLPVPNDRPSMHDLVVADVLKRKSVGYQRYGSFLQPFNGRDGLRDLYEELLDAIVYVRQVIEEDDEYAKQVAHLEDQLGEARMTVGRLRRYLRDAGLDEDTLRAAEEGRLKDIRDKIENYSPKS